MSEQNNIQVIQQAYACFGQGDVAGILSTLADDVVWFVTPVENVPYTGTRNGHAGAAEFFALMNELEDVTKFEPREFVAQGDKVVVIGQFGARVKATGRDYETYWVHNFTLQAGKIISFYEYTDTASITAAFAQAKAA